MTPETEQATVEVWNMHQKWKHRFFGLSKLATQIDHGPRYDERASDLDELFDLMSFVNYQWYMACEEEINNVA